MYTGFDIIPGGPADAQSMGGVVPAEKAAFMAAVAAGCPKFEVLFTLSQVQMIPIVSDTSFQCIVIASDISDVFPAPSGQMREFLRNFGVFPVILVNCHLEVR